MSNGSDQQTGKDWTVLNGDCVDLMAEMPESSVHLTVTSIPFASLYVYSASDRDFGNCRSHSEFFAQFRFWVEELYRVTVPGRIAAIHCMILPTSKTRDGVIGLSDFRGEVVRAMCGSEAQSLHEARTIMVRLGRDTAAIDDALVDASIHRGGWIFHSETAIWKDPVTAMQRTKALGLLHKQIKKDSAMSRTGILDYLCAFRKPGDNPEPIAHTDESFPVEKWQQIASPVWMNINPSKTLQRDSARDEADERHIAPLQTEVIDNCVELWSNPGDVVLDPFGGIGSTGVRAVAAGRRAVIFELKESYYKQAVANLRAAGRQTEIEGINR